MRKVTEGVVRRMEYIMNKVQTEYGYSDYQIKILQFLLTGVFYDISKILVFMMFFFAIGKFWEFWFAVVPLILLRTKIGGIHLHNYWTCFLASFVYLYAVINVLPTVVPVHPLAVYPVLLICAVLDYIIGPTTLKEKPTVQGETMINQKKALLKKAKIESFQVVFIVAILFYIFPNNPYLIVSLWTVVLNTFQLSITKLAKEVKHYEYESEKLA